jgi:lysozyme
VNLALLAAQLTIEEAVRLRPYLDTAKKITIGVGRNLTDRGISLPEAHVLLQNDIELAQAQCAAAFPWWASLDDVRQRVVADLCFNMGLGTLLQFKTTLSEIRTGDYAAASQAMLQSKWAQEVGARAVRLSTMLRTGLDT